eukprot:scaffold5605_cov128-Cylindrotheca_fusiformis.AAC.6
MGSWDGRRADRYLPWKPASPKNSVGRLPSHKRFKLLREARIPGFNFKRSNGHRTLNQGGGASRISQHSQDHRHLRKPLSVLNIYTGKEKK